MGWFQVLKINSAMRIKQFSKPNNKLRFHCKMEFDGKHLLLMPKLKFDAK